MRKEKFRIKCYVRYVDNILIGCRNEKNLKQVLDFESGICFIDEVINSKECVRIYRWSKN